MVLLPVVVICLTSRPSRVIVKICELPLRVDMNAMCRPFGEYAGLSLDPFAERQLAGLTGGEVEHLDVVAGPLCAAKAISL